MGGEKLKASRHHLGVIFLTLSIVAGFFGILFPLSAQTGDVSPGLESVPSPGTALSEGTTGSQGTSGSQGTNRSDESSIVIGEPPPVAPASGNGSSIFVVLRMVLVLALAALAIYGVVFFIKRLARPQESRDPHLKVLARVPLGSDSFAAVVSVGPKAWLVGGGSGGVNLISEIDDIESLETMLLDDARRSAEAETRGLIDFRSLLKRFGGGSRDKDTSPGSSHAQTLRKQRERLRGL